MSKNYQSGKSTEYSRLDRILEQAEDLIESEKPDEAIELLQPLVERYRRDADFQYYLGYAHAKDGNLWAAIPCYHKALELSRDYSLWIPLGFLYLDLDLRVLALHALRHARRSNPDDPALREVQDFFPSMEEEIHRIAGEMNLPEKVFEEGMSLMEEGQIALQNQDYSQCIYINRKASKILGTFPPPHNNLSMALYFRGQLQEAIQVAQQVLRDHPTNIQALANLIRFHIWSEHEAEAHAYWDVLKTQAPHTNDLRMKMVEAAAMVDDDQMVLQLVKEVDLKEIDDRGFVQRMQLYRAIAEANLGMSSAKGRLHRLLDVYPWAEEMYQSLKDGNKGLGWAPRYPYFYINELMPVCEFHAYINLLQRQDKMPEKQFRREVDRYVGKFPQIVQMGKKFLLEEQEVASGVKFLVTIGNPSAYQVLREFGLSQLGDDEARMKALFALLEAGQIQPDESLHVWHKGQWRDIHLRRYDVTDDADRDYSQKVVDMINQGLAAFQKDKITEAEELFRSILKLEPRAKEAYNNLGTIYARRGEHEQAKAMFHQAVEVDPLYVMARCNLASYLLDDEDVEAAAEMIAPLVDLQHINPQSLSFLSYIRARIAVEKDEFDEARNNLEIALEANPDNKPAQRLLENLDLTRNLRSGFESWQRRLEKGRKAARARMQQQIATPNPSLADALGIYTKEILTGMGRAIIPWGGWSTLKKAQLHHYLVENLQEELVLTHLLVDLSESESSALRMVLDQGGSMRWREFDEAYGNDLEESPYWQYHEPETLMGRLRLRGLLVEAIVNGELVIAIPMELRDLLKERLHANRIL